MVAAGFGIVGLSPDGMGYGAEYTTDTYSFLIAEHYGITGNTIITTIYLITMIDDSSLLCNLPVHCESLVGFSMLDAVNTWMGDKHNKSLAEHVIAGGYSEGGYGALVTTHCFASLWFT